MNESRGTYYDGRTSARRDVIVAFLEDGVRIRGEGIDVACPPAAVAAAPRVGRLHRTLRFADGSLCEVADGDLLDRWLARRGKGGSQRLLHRLETKLRYVVPAILLAVAGLAALITWGIPRAARRAAFALPPSTQKALGRQAMDILDRAVFSPSTLPGDRRAEVERLFRRMASEIPDGKGYRLELRAGRGIGANALALPSGIVVLTDEMVRLARHDEEIEAVLAHEIGHIRHRHALRHALQTSVAALLVATVSGDIVSATSLSAALPAALVHAKFSRDFEREADDAAAAWLDAHGIPGSRFGDLLERLEGERRGPQGLAREKERRPIEAYLSTHPLTEERLARFRRRPGGAR